MSKPAFLASPLNVLLTSAALGCVVLILVLSLLPAQEMPHTGIPKGTDHFIAYWGTGGLMALAFREGARTRAGIALGLIALAGLLEVLQHLSPGRTPMLSDFLLSSAGALVGLAMGAVAVHLLRTVRKTVSA